LNHRILCAVNDFIGQHDSWLVEHLRPVTIWIFHTPLVFVVVTMCVITLHAYFTKDRSSPAPEQLPPAPIEDNTMPPPDPPDTTHLTQCAVVLVDKIVFDT
jgi:hypothetical protein